MNYITSQCNSVGKTGTFIFLPHLTCRCEVLDKDVFHVAVKHMQQGKISYIQSYFNSSEATKCKLHYLTDFS